MDGDGKGQSTILEIKQNVAKGFAVKRRSIMSLTVELDEQTAAVVQKLAANEQRKGLVLNCCGKMPSLRRDGLRGSFNLPR